VLTVSGLLFGGVGLFMAVQAVRGERAASSRISENGRPVTGAEEKRFTRRLFAFAFCGSAVILFLCAYSVVRGPSKQEEELMKDMPNIPISPIRAACGIRRNMGNAINLPPVYLSPAMAHKTISGCCMLVVGMAAFLTASWFVWKMPTLIYQLAVFIMLLVGSAVLVPAIRTKLALKKLRIDVVAWTREARGGGDVEITFKVTAYAALQISAIRMALMGVSQSSGSDTTTREYLHTEMKSLAEDLKVEAGWSQDFRGRMKLPEGASQTDHVPPTRVCWIVGVTADVPWWPDLEVAREVRVR
jgi:hypothetical protein